MAQTGSHALTIGRWENLLAFFCHHILIPPPPPPPPPHKINFFEKFFQSTINVKQFGSI